MFVYLSCDDCFQFIERYRLEVIVVYAHIVLGREEHAQSGDVLSCLTSWSGVNVTEQLPCTIVGSAIAEEGIVIQDDLLTIYADAHLLGYIFEPVHKTLLCIFYIVVPEYQVNLPI